MTGTPQKGRLHGLSRSLTLDTAKTAIAMIKITAKSIVKAGAREEFIATARELVENSRAEAGNISYHLYEDIDDPNILTFIEEWKDQAAVDVHADSEHFQRIIPLLSDMTEEAIEISLYREVL